MTAQRLSKARPAMSATDLSTRMEPAPASTPTPSRPGRPRRRSSIKSPKAENAAACERLEQLPNIGPALAADLRLIGIHQPRDLVDQDGHALYLKLCALTGQRHDPCVLDTFLAATDFMAGAPAAPWWHYTALRKARYGSI